MIEIPNRCCIFEFRTNRVFVCNFPSLALSLCRGIITYVQNFCIPVSYLLTHSKYIIYIFMSSITVQPRYNAVVGVHKSEPRYKWTFHEVKFTISVKSNV